MYWHIVVDITRIIDGKDTILAWSKTFEHFTENIDSTFTKMASGRCILVNWLSQTRKNLTTKFLNLSFATRRIFSVVRILCSMKKLTLLRFILQIILYEKVFTFLRFDSFPFPKCIPLPSLSAVDILRIARRI